MLHRKSLFVQVPNIIEVWHILAKQCSNKVEVLFLTPLLYFSPDIDNNLKWDITPDVFVFSFLCHYSQKSRDKELQIEANIKSRGALEGTFSIILLFHMKSLPPLNYTVVELVASLLNCWRRNLETSEIVSIYKLLLAVHVFLQP